MPLGVGIGISLTRGFSGEAWLPPDGASFFMDEDQGHYALNGVKGTRADLVTPYEVSPSGLLFPIAEIGITGDECTIVLDATFPSIGGFQYLMEIASDDRSNDVEVYTDTDFTVACDFYKDGVNSGFTESTLIITDGLRLVTGFAVDSSGVLFKVGDEDEVTMSGAGPVGLTKLGVGCNVAEGGTSGLVIHTLTVYNSKLAHVPQ